jgi:ABC-type transport system substrate-binding protein
MPPFMLGYNDAIVDYPYDPAKAIELLTEAGYPNGFNTTLWVMPVSRPYMFDPTKIGEAIQSYLEAVNIHVTIYQIDWATYLAKTQAGEHPMCLLGWTGDNGDPDNFMNVLYGANQCAIGTAGNVAFYNNSDVQDLFTAALETYTITERAELYEEAQVIIHDDAPFVYLAHANQHVVFRSNVKGYIMNPAGRTFFYPVEIQEPPQEPVRAFIFGKIANLSTQGDYMTFEAVKTRMITFSPFSFNTYISGENFIILKNDFIGRVLIRPHSYYSYIIALCKILI